MTVTTPPAVAPGAAPRRPLASWLEDPAVVLALAMAMVVVAYVPLGPLRAVANLPLVLLLPGHALLLVVGSPDRGLELAARIGLRLVTSLALVSLALLAVGSVVTLHRPVVILTVWAITASLGVGALVQPRVATDGPPTLWSQSGVLLSGALVITTALVVVGVALLPAPREEPFSRLSVAGRTLEAGTPLEVTDRAIDVELEVENGDDRSHRYGVIAAIDGGAQWESVATRVAAGATWTGTVRGRVPEDACLSRLRVSLTLDGEPSDVNPLILYLRNERGDACS